MDWASGKWRLLYHFEGRIESLIDFVTPAILIHSIRARLERSRFAYGNPANIENRRELTRPYHGQQGRTVRGTFFRLERCHRLTKHIREHLAPEPAPGAAA